MKQGIMKAGKRFFCDLMFSNENEDFIHWVGQLEEFSQKYIYENRSRWFETEIDMHDIENSFSPSMKVYKSGKYYLVRSHIPTVLGKCVLKIYDEHESELNYESISENANVVTILEMQGIKCSARSFQIEIEIKQMLVLKPLVMFEKSVFGKKQHLDSVSNNHSSIESLDETSSDLHTPFENTAVESLGETVTLSSPVESLGDCSSSISSSESLSRNILLNSTTESLGDCSSQNTFENSVAESLGETYPLPQNTIESNVSDSLDKRALLSNPLEIFSQNMDEPYEIDFPLHSLPEDDTVQLKDRNDVYYKMYREAKRKAKISRDLALSSYMEVHRIKNTYMLDSIVDSDSDLDEESFNFETA
jgi:hypothetical protein